MESPAVTAAPAVLLVTHAAAAPRWIAPLEAAGYTVVVHDRADAHTYRWIRDERPAAILVDTAARATLPLVELLHRLPWATSLRILTAPTTDAQRVTASLGPA